MNIDEALPTFITEARELLREMEAGLLACEQNGADTDTVNAIFRSAHTLKGAAGLFGLDPIVSFTHVMETALDRVRSGKCTMTEDLTALMIEGTDHLVAVVEEIAGGGNVQALSMQSSGEQLLARLRVVADVSTDAAGKTASKPAADAAPAAPSEARWRISLRFKPDVLRNGMDPLSFIRYLTTFGEIEELQVLTDKVPPLDALDAECCYLGYEIDFRTTEKRARIEAAFEFVREDCELGIVQHGAAASASNAEQANKAARADSKLVAADGKPAAGDAKNIEKRTIRVEADKLDRLIDLIGELIVAGASTNLIASRAKLADLSESASRLSRLVEEVRDSALTLRMVQIGGTFSRFHRIVRDVARDLGKQIDLEITGAETELDKTVVERINDPLVHLVRNAMDHGIEPAEVREQRGKPARAKVRLNAYHDSGSVVIEVSDDGGGINKERVLAKAIERGLVAADAVLSDKEVFALIMEPGFSTASVISNLSGRGVGMDVVKSNVEELRGSIEIQSQPGAGTTVQIRLPLTLAIIDGFQMRVDGASYVVPLNMVEECVELPEGSSFVGDYFDLRGKVLPFLRLRELFESDRPRPARESVVVVRWGSERLGLVVDALDGELQAVIKPLGKMFARLRGISGSTILGSGAVALILDVPALCQMASHPGRKQKNSALIEGSQTCSVI
jgi:two-component system, chemotaxis family, sensor kinase CheA